LLNAKVPVAVDAAKLLTGETLYIDGGYHIID
jgi:enoyl-[acyl-carrier-protein] reductase (NADH)